jgi:putative transposase
MKSRAHPNVDEHNHVLPHAAFQGQTPDEMYFGARDAIPAELAARADAARRACGHPRVTRRP